MSAAEIARIERTAQSLRAEREASGPTVRIVRGDAVKLEPVRWAWRGFLPLGMLTILAGAPGCGKTTIALSLAATITTGGTWPDESKAGVAGDVLIWSGEDAHEVLAARLAASGADMRRVHFVDGVTGDDDDAFDPSRDMPLLEAVAERLPELRLLLLDPIVSAVAGDSHKNAEVRRALQPVVAMAHRLGCAVLGITHLSKGTAGRDPVERITGSLAFAALARVVLVAAKVRAEGEADEARRVLVRAKSNIGPDDGGFEYSLTRVDVAPEVEGQRVTWGQAIEGTARDVLANAEAGPDMDEDVTVNDGATALLRDLLKGAASLPSGEAIRRMKAEGFTDKMIRRAREKLSVVVERQGFGRTMQSLWSLPRVPSDAIRALSYPVMPMQKGGHEWARMAPEGTNGAPDPDDAERC